MCNMAPIQLLGIRWQLDVSRVRTEKNELVDKVDCQSALEDSELPV